MRVVGPRDDERETLVPALDDGDVRVFVGDCREVLAGLPERSVHCVVTSPPYFGLRDYGTAEWDEGDPDCVHDTGGTPQVPQSINRGAAPSIVAGGNRGGGRVCVKCGALRVDRQIGLEESVGEYVESLVHVFGEVRRVLRDDGTVWLNLGDSYNGAPAGNVVPSGFSQTRPSRVSGVQETVKHGRGLVAGLKPKDLIGVPWRVALALQADGWWLRSAIVWEKPNPMPESVTDRPTQTHEMVFLLSKRESYFYDYWALTEEGSQNRWGGATAKGSDAWKGGARVRDRDGRTMLPERRNGRNVWRVATRPFAGAHFATMPIELASKCVLGGSSPRGCCPECGAPMERVFEKVRVEDAPPSGNRETGRWTGGESQVGGRLERRPVGWRATCKHAFAAPVPCVVLDPFAGAGTTLLAARNSGRHSIGVELNPKYVDGVLGPRLAQQSLLTLDASGDDEDDEHDQEYEEGGAEADGHGAGSPLVEGL